MALAFAVVLLTTVSLQPTLVLGESIFVGLLNNTAQPSKLVLKDTRHNSDHFDETAYFPRSDIHGGVFFAFVTDLAAHERYHIGDYLVARTDSGRFRRPITSDGCSDKYVLHLSEETTIHVISGPSASTTIIGSNGLRVNRYGPNYTTLRAETNSLLTITATADEKWPGACQLGSERVIDDDVESEHDYNTNGLPLLVVWTVKEPRDIVIRPPMGIVDLFISNGNQPPPPPHLQVIYV